MKKNISRILVIFLGMSCLYSFSRWKYYKTTNEEAGLTMENFRNTGRLPATIVSVEALHALEANAKQSQSEWFNKIIVEIFSIGLFTLYIFVKEDQV